MSPTTIDPYQMYNFLFGNCICDLPSQIIETEKKVTKEITERIYISNYLLPWATIETNRNKRRNKGTSENCPTATGNRILVARGNNWIQYGCQIKNREKLSKCTQSRQEVEFLVARGNN